MNLTKEEFFNRLDAELTKSDCKHWDTFRLRICDKNIKMHYQSPTYTKIVKGIFKPFITENENLSDENDFYLWVGDLNKLIPNPTERIIAEKDNCSLVNLPSIGMWAADKNKRKYWCCIEKEREKQYIAEGILSAKKLGCFKTFGQWSNENGLGIVHAATIGDETGMLLIIGKASSGKSVFCVNAIRQGFHTQGDDYLFISLNGDVSGYPFYSSLNTNNRDYIPKDWTELRGSDWRKYSWDISKYIVNKKTPVKAIITLTNDANDQPWIEKTNRRRMIYQTIASSVSQVSLIRNDETIHQLQSQLLKLPRYTLHQNIEKNSSYDIRNILKQDAFLKDFVKNID